MRRFAQLYRARGPPGYFCNLAFFNIDILLYLRTAKLRPLCFRQGIPKSVICDIVVLRKLQSLPVSAPPQGIDSVHAVFAEVVAQLAVLYSDVLDAVAIVRKGKAAVRPHENGQRICHGVRSGKPLAKPGRVQFYESADLGHKLGVALDLLEHFSAPRARRPKQADKVKMAHDVGPDGLKHVILKIKVCAEERLEVAAEARERTIKELW